MEEAAVKKHFVLVHGACHGAWCWYKLSTLLSSHGHRVTAIDLAASGVDTRSIADIPDLSGYSQPLTDVVAHLPPGEKVILVGHSFGGLSISLAMDRYPEKVEAGVFVTAFLPDCSRQPSYVVEEHQKHSEQGIFVDDTQCSFKNGHEKHFTSFLFGPAVLASKLYQCCPPEDYTLAITLVREGSLFLGDLSIHPPFSKQNYGSVKKIYIVSKKDEIITEEFQKWMISNYPVDEVKEIEGADHMAMLSKPQELCKYLLEIADTST